MPGVLEEVRYKIVFTLIFVQYDYVIFIQYYLIFLMKNNTKKYIDRIERFIFR